MASGVYHIINTVNGHDYIGSSGVLDRRLPQHLSHSSNQPLRRAIRKYGAEKFAINILEFCLPEACVDREQRWIDQLQPHYNISLTAGSPLGYRHDEATKLRMRTTKRSSEFRAKCSARMKGNTMRRGAKLTVVTKAKMSTAHRGNQHLKGYTHSEASKAKIGASLRKYHSERNGQ